MTAVGYCLGVIYEWSHERRRRFLTRLGLALIAAFVVLRAVNIYGDPVPASTCCAPGMTASSRSAAILCSSYV